jgi:hypothetical protein
VNFEIACYLGLFRVILKSCPLECVGGWGGLGVAATDKLLFVDISDGGNYSCVFMRLKDLKTGSLLRKLCGLKPLERILRCDKYRPFITKETDV